MDSISYAQGGATNLSTPQKVLATLLSIILVVGLSPLGKAPGKAWAEPTNTTDVKLATLYTPASTDTAPDTWTQEAEFESSTVNSSIYNSVLKSQVLPVVSPVQVAKTETNSHWVGVTVPNTGNNGIKVDSTSNLTVPAAIGQTTGGYKAASGYEAPDGVYAVDGTDETTVYFDLGNNEFNENGGKFQIFVGNNSGDTATADTAIFNIDASNVKPGYMLTLESPDNTTLSGTASNTGGNVTLSEGESKAVEVGKDVALTQTAANGYSAAKVYGYRTGDANKAAIATKEGATETPASNTFLMPAYDVTATATVTAIEHTLAKDAAENGSFALEVGGREAAKATVADTVTVVPSPAAGYSVVTTHGVQYKIGDGGSYTDITPGGDGSYKLDLSSLASSLTTAQTITFKVAFEIKQNNLTLNKPNKGSYKYAVTGGANGTVTSSDATASNVAYGTTVTISDIEDVPGYSVGEVSFTPAGGQKTVLTGDSGAYTFRMPDAATAVDVAYEAQALAVTKGAIAFGDVSIDKATAKPGEKVTVTATPASGYTLASTDPVVASYGDSSKAVVKANLDGTYSFAMPTEPVTVTASFVTAKPSGHEGGATGTDTVTVHVGDKDYGYADLASAVADLNAGKLGSNPTIQLAYDSAISVASSVVSILKPATIDLNGKKLTVSRANGATATTAAITVGADTVFTDSTAKDGAVDSDICGANSSALFSVAKGAKLTVKDVKDISADGTVVETAAGDSTLSGSAVVLEGSAISETPAAASQHAVKVASGASLKMETGSIAVNESAVAGNARGANAVYADGGASVVLGKEGVDADGKAGTPTIESIAPAVATAAKGSYPHAKAGVTVYGGSYAAYGWSGSTTAAVSVAGTDSKVAIKGGLFYGKVASVEVSSNTATLDIEGGTFDHGASEVATDVNGAGLNFTAVGAGMVNVAGGTYKGNALLPGATVGQEYDLYAGLISGGTFARDLESVYPVSTSTPTAPVTVVNEYSAVDHAAGTAVWTVKRAIDAGVYTDEAKSSPWTGVAYNGKVHIPYLKVAAKSADLGAADAFEDAEYTATLYKGKAQNSTDMRSVKKVDDASLVDAGWYTYVVTPTDADRFSGTVYAPFEIKAVALSASNPDFTIQLRDGAQGEWTDLAKFGMAKRTAGCKPDVRIKYKDTWVQDPDASPAVANFKVEYGTNNAKGNGTVEVTAKAGYANITTDPAVTLTFAITDYDITTGASYNHSLPAATYKGAVQNDLIKLKDDAVKAIGAYISGTAIDLDLTNCDIVVTKPDNVEKALASSDIDGSGYITGVFEDAGDYVITYTPKAGQDFSGKLQVTYTVAPYTIPAGSVNLVPNLTYDGTKTQDPVDRIYGIGKGASGLTKGVDYEIDPEFVETGGDDPQSFTVKGIGNYTTADDNAGVTKQITVKKGAFDKATISNGTGTAVKSFPYTGKAVEPEFAFTLNSTAVTPSEDDYTVKYYKMKDDKTYDETAEVEPVAAGTYKAKLAGAAGFTGAAEAVFEVTGVDITAPSKVSEITITLKEAAKYITYAGKAIDPMEFVDAEKTTIKYAGEAEAVALSTADFSLIPEKISDAGTFDADDFTIKGNGNLTGELAAGSTNPKVTFDGFVRIKGADLSEGVTVDPIGDLTYSGDKQVPELTVKTAEGAELAAGTDYDAKFTQKTDGNGDEVSGTAADSVTDAGTYGVELVGKGAYNGTSLDYDGVLTVKSFDLNDLTDLKLPAVETAVANSPLTYNGGEQAPAVSGVTAKLGKKAVTLGTATGEIAFDAVTDAKADPYTNLVMHGKGNYTGDVATKYAVTVNKLAVDATLGTFAVEYSNNGVWVPTYTGTVQTNAPKVRIVYTDPAGVVNVLPEADYGVKYDKNTAVTTSPSYGPAEVKATVAADGNLTSSDATAAFAEGTYKIVETGLVDANLALAAALTTGGASTTIPETFDNQSRTLTATVTPTGEAALTAGTGYVLYYKLGSWEEDAAAKPVNGSDFAVGSDDGKFEFTDAGTYQLIAVGLTVAGTASKTFTVAPLDLSAATLSDKVAKVTDGVSSKTFKQKGVYSGKEWVLDTSYYHDATTTPSARSTLGDDILEFASAPEANIAFQDIDEIAYEGNVDAGTAKAAITLADEENKNYAGGKTVEFEIAKAKLKDLYNVVSKEVVYKNGAYSYKSDQANGYDFTGEQVKPEVQVVLDDASGTAEYNQAGWSTVVDPLKYTVTYGPNIDPNANNTSNKAVVELTDPEMLNNLEGTAEMAVYINKAKFTADDLTVANADQPYTGQAIDGIKLSKGNYDLVPGYDYFVDYKGTNTEVGTATAHLVGNGAFESTSFDASFKIVAAKITGLTLASPRATYNGKAQAPAVKAVATDGYVPAAGEYAVTYLRGGKATDDLKSAGDVTVRVTAAPGNTHVAGSADAVYTIQKAANPATAKAAAATIAPKGTTTVTASGAGNVSFTSSNKKVATVDSKGKVTGVAPGKATITASFAGDGNYEAGKATVTVEVKKANTLTVKAKTATVKAKKKNQTIKRAKVLTVSKAKGTVTYKKVSGNSKIAVNAKNGKVTVKKGIKAGKTYKVKVAVTAKGNATYSAKTVTKTFKVKVTK